MSSSESESILPKHEITTLNEEAANEETKKTWEKEILTTRRQSVKDISARFKGKSLVETKEQCEDRMRAYKKISTINKLGQNNKEALQRMSSSHKITMLSEWSSVVQTENIGEVNLDTAKEFLAQYGITSDEVDAAHWEEWLQAINHTTKVTNDHIKPQQSALEPRETTTTTSSNITTTLHGNKEKTVPETITSSSSLSSESPYKRKDLHVNTMTTPSHDDDVLASSQSSQSQSQSGTHYAEDDSSDFGDNLAFAHLTPLRLPNQHSILRNPTSATQDKLHDTYFSSQLFISPDGQQQRPMDFLSPTITTTNHNNNHNNHNHNNHYVTPSSHQHHHYHPHNTHTKTNNKINQQLEFSPVFPDSPLSTTGHNNNTISRNHAEEEENEVGEEDEEEDHPNNRLSENPFVKQDHARRLSMNTTLEHPMNTMNTSTSTHTIHAIELETPIVNKSNHNPMHLEAATAAVPGDDATTVLTTTTTITITKATETSASTEVKKEESQKCCCIIS